MGFDEIRRDVLRHTQRAKVMGILGDLLFAGQSAVNEASTADVMTREQARRVLQALMVIGAVNGELATEHLDYINATADGGDA